MQSYQNPQNTNPGFKKTSDVAKERKHLMRYCQEILNPNDKAVSHVRKEIRSRKELVEKKNKEMQSLQEEINDLNQQIIDLKREKNSLHVPKEKESLYRQLVAKVESQSDDCLISTSRRETLKKELVEMCKNSSKSCNSDATHSSPARSDPELTVLNRLSYKGPGERTYACDLGTFTKKLAGDCGISVNGHANEGIHKWEISYLPIDHEGWLLIGLQVNKSKCTSGSSYLEKETYGINIHNADYSSTCGYKYIGGHQSKHPSKIGAHKGEILTATLDCNTGTFSVEGKEFNTSINIPTGEKYYLHFNPGNASFRIVSHEIIS
uniref:Uncharacterized protein n=1 Tax=Vannella robusta TaxID=1487602 RepID=A0A7S4MCW1_9EUKA|mmetsp:Transcript_18513/g.23463  ORF Transcript_18513/g.23463 Transcript_18513/m.23463 type:complete len:322 (+) Transcript_18513:122-1087(+)